MSHAYVSKAIFTNAIICFFEPNQKLIKIIKENDTSHPDAADPNEYIQDLIWHYRKWRGFF